ncbi:MAG: DUF362 domain-containing protein [Candidatus Helarchaeota archaeon]
MSDRHVKVAIVKGTQYSATLEALELMEDVIKVPTEEDIVILPNLLTTMQSEIVNTDYRVCLAVMDFYKEVFGINETSCIIMGGTTHGNPANSLKALENNHYLEDNRNWKLFDNSEDLPGKWFKIYEQGGEGITELALGKKLIESGYVISVPKFKTHDVLGLTLSLKNLMGGLVAARNIEGTIIAEKPTNVCPLMHGFGFRRPHQLSDEENTSTSKLCLAINLVRMVKIKQPTLAVIDGVNAMEGNGPLSGIKKELGLIIASNDFIAADIVATYIAGMKPEDMQYILQAGKLGLGEYRLANIEIVGENLEEVIDPFIPHRLFNRAIFKETEIDILRNST